MTDHRKSSGPRIIRRSETNEVSESKIIRDLLTSSAEDPRAKTGSVPLVPSFSREVPPARVAGKPAVVNQKTPEPTRAPRRWHLVVGAFVLVALVLGLSAFLWMKLGGNFPGQPLWRKVVTEARQLTSSERAPGAAGPQAAAAKPLSPSPVAPAPVPTAIAPAAAAPAPGITSATPAPVEQTKASVKKKQKRKHKKSAVARQSPMSEQEIEAE